MAFREARVQTWFSQAFKGAGALVLNVHGHAMQSPGWPDLQVYHRIWTGHIELKIKGNRVVKDSRQDRVLRGLATRGVKVCWISVQEDRSAMVYVLRDDEWTAVPVPFRCTGKTVDSRGVDLLRLLSVTAV